MQLDVDNEKFDDKQSRFVAVLLDEIFSTLGEEIDPYTSHENLLNVTRMVVLKFASILDGSTTITGKHKDLVPHLTFADSKKRNSIVADENGTSIHQYVHGWCEELGMLPD